MVGYKRSLNIDSVMKIKESRKDLCSLNFWTISEIQSLRENSLAGCSDLRKIAGRV